MITNKKVTILILLGILYTLSVIFLSIGIKDYIDSQKLGYLGYEYKYEILDINAYDLYSDYMNLWKDGNSSAECKYKNEILKDFDSQLKEISSKLSLYAPSSSMFKEMYYDYLKRKYYLIQLKEYYFLLKFREECKNVNVIIYFFNRENTDSQIMGKVLSEAAKQLNNTYVVAFDIQYKDISILNLIKERYNITENEAPVFVINDKYKYSGMYTKEDVINLINMTSKIQ